MSIECWTDRASKLAAVKVGYSFPEWCAWDFEKADQGGLFLTGAICPLKTRGKNKGKPNYRSHDPKTKRTVYLTKEECAEIY